VPLRFCCSKTKLVLINTRGDNKNGNPFEATGYFETWTMTGRAKNVAVPTLVIIGVNEVASGDAAKPFLEEIPDVRLVKLDGTTHSPHLESKDKYMETVALFLKD
jgi:pimeloyl-ACP methyl ester carboxylesterase